MHAAHKPFPVQKYLKFIRNMWIVQWQNNLMYQKNMRNFRVAAVVFNTFVVDFVYHIYIPKVLKWWHMHHSISLFTKKKYCSIIVPSLYPCKFCKFVDSFWRMIEMESLRNICKQGGPLKLSLLKEKKVLQDFFIKTNALYLFCNNILLNKYELLAVFAILNFL